MFAREPPSSSNPTKRLCRGISSVVELSCRLLPADRQREPRQREPRQREHRQRVSRLDAAAFLARSETKTVSACFLARRVVRGWAVDQLAIELIQTRRRLTESVQRIELSADFF